MAQNNYTMGNNALIIEDSTGITTVSPIGADIVDRFIKYVDRTERTTNNYLICIRQFAAWLNYAGISDPGRDDVRAYRDYLKSEHYAIMYDAENPNGWSYRRDSNGNKIMLSCKPGTVEQYIRALKQFYKWAVSESLVPRDITLNIHANTDESRASKNEHKKDALDLEAIKAVESTIDRTTLTGKRLYAMFELMINAGVRCIEISRAKIKDLEVKNDRAVLWIYGKGHSSADTRKPLSAGVYNAICEYLDARADNYTANSPLFAATGNRNQGGHIAHTTISTMIKNALVTAGYDSERLTAHSLRHTTGSSVMQITGNNIYSTQQYMRHSNPATTEKYLDNNKAAFNAELADRVYLFQHGQDGQQDIKSQLNDILDRMNNEQLAQMLAIAKQIIK